MKEVFQIMVIDDDPICNLLTTKVIEKANIESKIEVYNNPLDALKKLQKGVGSMPDLIFLDLNMPVLHGWEFVSLFLELEPKRTKDVSLIILSASSNQSDLDKALEVECIKKYITKPLQTGEVRSLYNNIKPN
jgi:CheY-like chemotaxis protein